MSLPLRIPALRRFAIAISVLTILGHTVLGFEQSWAHVLAVLATTYSIELLLETLNSRSLGLRPRFLGGRTRLVDFLLPAHISGLALAMLLYPNARLTPLCFAASVAIGSKWLFRVPVGSGSRHYLNPSNTGITATLLLFPWVGIAPPYQFTENIAGAWDWIVPAIIICSGSFLNARYTQRVPVILGWLGAFFAQAVVRSVWLGSPFAAGLVPMTGVAFLLFTFYMVSDPATTPSRPRAQVIFGAAVGVGYGVLMAFHVVFGLFFALTAVCALRGLTMFAAHVLQGGYQPATSRGADRVDLEALAPAGRR